MPFTDWLEMAVIWVAYLIRALIRSSGFIMRMYPVVGLFSYVLTNIFQSQVDRLFAMWQVLYPNSFVTSQVNIRGTFTDPPGSTENSDTALTPFHSAEPGSLYTSNTARYTKPFGYTYPEIVDWSVSADQLASNVRTKLNTLYNPSSNITKRDGFNSTSSSYQYFVNIAVDKDALSSTSFFVHFFLGPFADNPTTWSYDPALAGSHTIFAASAPASNQASNIVFGQIPLTHSLEKAMTSGILPDLSPSNVIPVLKKQLNWRIQRFDDSAVDVKEVPSLQVHVVGQEVHPAKDPKKDFPIFGEMVAYDSVTAGKAGGVSATKDP